MVLIGSTGVFEDNYFQRLKIRKEFVDICKSKLEDSTKFYDYLSGTRKFCGNDLEVEIVSGRVTDSGKQGYSVNYGRVGVTLESQSPKEKGNELFDEIYTKLKVVADKYKSHN